MCTKNRVHHRNCNSRVFTTWPTAEIYSFLFVFPACPHKMSWQYFLCENYSNLLDSVNFIKQIMLTFIPAKLDPGCNTSKPYSLQLYIYNQSCRRGNDTASRDFYFLFFSTYLWNQWDLVIQNKFLQRDKLQYNVLRVIFIIYY